jgi:hypothetical protein
MFHKMKMKKLLFAIILLFGAMQSAVAQTPDSTLVEGQDLGEVTVTASATTNRLDRKLIFPSERQKKLSSNGVDLLQQLMLPKLQVNPLSDNVSLPGGGEIQYRINGVKVGIQEIVALQPAGIIRIEYHDNPGLRYGNAEVVLDYIVRRPETGGTVGVNLSDALTAAWGNNYLNGRINHKKSEFSVNYSIRHRDFYEMWRDNEEQFTFADGSTLHRKETGEPGRAELVWQTLNTAYSYQNDKQVFNAAFRYYTSNQPHWDYEGSLYNVANPADAVRMIDRTKEKINRPALDLYYQQQLKNDQTVVVNLVGTYNYTDNNRLYQESCGDVLLTDVNNGVTGKKYSVIGEGIYEKKLGANRISAGLRHTQSQTNNEYKSSASEMNQSETFLYGEWKGKARKMDYSVGAGFTRSFFGQEGAGEDYQYYTFNPRVTLHYALPGRSFIRLRSEISNSSPSLSNLDAVDQMIDSLQILRGNPNLKPFHRYHTELTYELQKGIFYGSLQGQYDYHPDAIMDEKRLEGDKIIQTWDNQKNWQCAGGMLFLRVGPIREILQISVREGVNHYVSNGNNYAHTYTNWFTNMEMLAAYKGFSVGAGMETNWNRFYGETLTGGENLHYIVLGYKHKNMSLRLGMNYPFSDNYKQDTENWSRYASYKKSNYLRESSRMLLVRFVYNISFGRKFNSGEKRLNNADDESGVMNVGK